MSNYEDETLDSIATVVEAILPLAVLERHKRDVINGLLWKLTEVRGKYKTRHRSAAACSAAKGAALQHEHVFTKKDLTDRILAEPSRAREFLGMAVGCVVTKEEHDILTAVTRKNPQLKGWERYQAAGIVVVDTDGQTPQ